MRKKYNQAAHNEEMQKSHQHVKRCLTLIRATELQIKTTMQYYFSPIRLAKIQMTTFSLGNSV